MIPGLHGFSRFIADAMILSVAACGGVLCFWWWQNTALPSTEPENFRIVEIASARGERRPDLTTAYAGDIIKVKFDVVRNRTCQLDIQRMIARTDTGQELQLQRVSQWFEGDGVRLFDREFTIQIPPELSLNPGVYRFFNRVRYYCNGLDVLKPRIRITSDLPIRIASHPQ